ncbi:elongation factor P 5-aminopentanone reductase [Heyndrickxia acidicola]|uniref:SDR family oxidoreductase n=1 Tax=Heyndrickxia acidicola TaxID=209389 RepID=A0ABU6MBJ0_9BACI|nr:SDR family oxidoreductase [Heyndrickxia acidicola]MED1202006.1 SDR family oxidoreductase [Heyndrickxia acidicola]
MKKFALITGASGGIGRAAAVNLAKKGWNLYLHYHQNKTEMENLLRELNAYNLDLIPICADLTTKAGIQVLLESIFQIDAVCYISGTSHYGLFEETSEEIMDELYLLHVKAPMVIVQKLMPKLMRNHSSRVLLVSSIWGQTGASCEVAYSAAKGAQISFVKALSKEVARNGVLVNAIAPGSVRTAMLDSFTEQELIDLQEDIPLGRLADPSEIAGAITFLLSDDSSYITGQVIGVNGGWYT